MNLKLLDPTHCLIHNGHIHTRSGKVSKRTKGRGEGTGGAGGRGRGRGVRVSIQVSGDGPTLPSLTPKVWVGASLGLGLREGRVGPSPETWIDPGEGREGSSLGRWWWCCGWDVSRLLMLDSRNAPSSIGRFSWSCCGVPQVWRPVS